MTAQAPAFADAAAGATDLRAAAEAWRRRSRVVRFWRRTLPGAMALIGLVFVGQLAFRGVMASAPEQVQQAEIRIVDARFLGRDARGRQFELRAAEAVRVPSDPGAVRMTRPVLTVFRADGQPVTIVSRRGYWNDREQVARMTEQVVVTDPTQGYVFRTEEAVADTRGNVVTGSTPVDGHGPFGRISAQSFAIYDQGARFVFSGQVRTRLNQGAPGLGANGATR